MADDDEDEDQVDEKDPSLAQPHDALIQRTFGSVEHARGELQAVLPGALVQLIDWNTLTIEPPLAVNPKLRKRQSDFLYRVELRGHPAFIYTVFEAQRKVDKTMGLRLWAAMARVWDPWLRRRDASWPPPLILPVVLHHGDRPWNRSPQFADIFELPAELAEALHPFIPHFSFLLDDLPDIPDELLLQRPLSALAHLVLGALKHARDPDIAQRFFRHWHPFIEELLGDEHGEKELETLLGYILIVNQGIEAEELGNIMVEHYGPEGEKIAKTAGARLIQQGRQEGQQEELKQNLLRVMKSRFPALPAHIEERILACMEVETLRDWFQRALRIEAPAELFEN